MVKKQHSCVGNQVMLKTKLVPSQSMCYLCRRLKISSLLPMLYRKSYAGHSNFLPQGMWGGGLWGWPIMICSSNHYKDGLTTRKLKFITTTVYFNKA